MREPMPDRKETLARGAVHVWLLDPDAPAARALLRGHRPQKTNTIAPGLQRRQLLSQALVRRALSRYSAVAPQAWKFGTAPGGRPRVMGPGRANLFFSLSTTPGLVACAVARLPMVGLDVEAVEAVKAVGAAAAFPSELRLLTLAEARSLRRLPPRQRPLRFYALWTLKEAYLKARGVGLAVPPWTVGFRLGKRIRVELRAGHERTRKANDRWKFNVLRPTPHHFSAVAARWLGNTPLAVTTRWWGV